MFDAKAQGPKASQNERDQRLKRSAVHRLSLTETGHQCRNALGRPPTYSQRTGPFFHVDTFARSENHACLRSGPSHGNASGDDKDGRFGLLNVHRPFRASHRGDGLRRDDLKAGFTLPGWAIDQQCFESQRGRICISVSVMSISVN